MGLRLATAGLCVVAMAVIVLCERLQAGPYLRWASQILALTPFLLPRLFAAVGASGVRGDFNLHWLAYKGSMPFGRRFGVLLGWAVLFLAWAILRPMPYGLLLLPAVVLLVTVMDMFMPDRRQGEGA